MARLLVLVLALSCALPGLALKCATNADCKTEGMCAIAKEKCVARKKVNATCAVTRDCVEEAYCPKTVLKCTPYKQIGDRCSDSTECTTAPVWTYCDADIGVENGTCVKAIEPLTDVCTHDIQCCQDCMESVTGSQTTGYICSEIREMCIGDDWYDVRGGIGALVGYILGGMVGLVCGLCIIGYLVYSRCNPWAPDKVAKRARESTIKRASQVKVTGK